MKTLLRRLDWFLHRDRYERELEEELSHHRAQLQNPNRLGNLTLIKEDSRLMWIGHLPSQLAQDIRYGFRAMAHNKLFTAMAVLSLALAIGANTAIYSYVDAILVKALPVRHPENLVIVNWRAKGDEPAIVHGMTGDTFSDSGGYTTSPNLPFPAWEQMRDRQTTLENLFAYINAGDLNVIASGEAKAESPQYVSGSFFEGLGINPAAGRLIGNADDRFGSANIAVLSYDLWTSRFASDTNIVGSSILINNQRFTVAGVAAPGFYGVHPGRRARIFLPLHALPLFTSRGTVKNAEASFSDVNYYWVEMMGRLRPGVPMERAQAELEGIFHPFVVASAKTDKDRAAFPFIHLMPGGSGKDATRRYYSKPLYVLMTMVGLILAIACANVANLLLSRSTARRREMAVRLSLGASRGRVIRQLLTESVMLAGIAGVLGIAVGSAGIRFLQLLLSIGHRDNVDRIIATLDLRVLTFTLAVAAATGLIFGLAPALSSTKVDVAPALKEARTGESRRHRRFGIPFGLTHVLMVGQIAISLLLVVAAGLFVRTLNKLHSVQVGFNSENVLLFSLNPRKAGIAPDNLAVYVRQVQQRVNALPGVRAATMTTVPMVAGWSDGFTISVPGIPESSHPHMSYMAVAPGFFATMQIPILLGRVIQDTDLATAPRIAVINEVFAGKYFPGVSPIGRHFGMGSKEKARDYEIVGVARTARYNSLKREIPPVAYFSWAQTPPNQPLDDLFFEVRTAGDPLRLANSVRRLVHDFSPMVPVTGISTQTDRIEGTISNELTFARLGACFAALALVIACVGLYGTIAYAVARRTAEIGIRVALGAGRARIRWMVMSEVAAMTIAGLAMGLAAALQLSQFVASFLFELKPKDPLTFTVSLVVLGVAALLAGYAPAWRASRIDPMVALRHE